MSTKPNQIEIERLAVAFRTNPRSGNLGHSDVWDAMERIGGRAAILYGMYLATPARQRRKKLDLAMDIANALDEIARRAAR